MKRLLQLSLLALFFVACEKEIQIELPDVPVELVVEGIVDINRPPLVILTRTQGYFDPIDNNTINGLFVNGAVVSLNNGTQTHDLIEICTSSIPDSILVAISGTVGISAEDLQAFNYCVYTSLDPTSFGEAGKTYQLNVQADGKTLTAVTKIPEPVYFDSIWYELGTNQDSLGFVWVDMKDPDTIGNSYRWFAQRINHYTYGPQVGEMKDKQMIAPLGSIFDDKFFNGQKFEFAYNRGELGNNENQDDEGPEERFFKNGDTVVVQFVSIDRPNFFYFRSLEDQIATNGSPFASPGNLESNINGGYGVFSGYGSAYDTVVCTP
ncbi:DUF4249 domain-containing protein [Flavobacteriales bacterium]|nr:DUF4249 domain-containing protein [Flavobacteriales bacterium]